MREVGEYQTTLDFCGHKPKSPFVDFAQGETKKKLVGLVGCNDIWRCPVCAGKLQAKRETELQDLERRARQAGFNVLFLTLTARHSKYDDLTKLLDTFGRARQKLRNRKRWKRIFEELDAVGTVRVLELTYGENGWHVHSHEMIIYRGQEVQTTKSKENPHGLSELSPLAVLELRAEAEKNPEKWKEFGALPLVSQLLAEWLQACADSGAKIPNERGVSLLPGVDASKYLAKWGIASELASSTKKLAKDGHYTPWQLLSAAHAGDPEAALLWQDYALAIRGKRQIMASPGIKATLKKVFLPDDQLALEIEEKENTGLTVQGSIDADSWLWCVDDREPGISKPLLLLELFETGGFSEVENYFLEHYPKTSFSRRVRELREAEKRSREAPKQAKKTQCNFYADLMFKKSSAFDEKTR